MSKLTEPSPSDFDRWQQLIVDGRDPSQAARELGFNGSTTFKRADPARHADALEIHRERWRSEDRVLARDTLRNVALTGENEGARVSAANTLAKMGGLLDDVHKVEVTGAEGGPIAVEGGATLADVGAVLVAVGALPGSQPGSPEVPAAGPILAEPS